MKDGLLVVVGTAKAVYLSMPIKRMDFTIIPKFIKLRPLFLSGWYTTFLLILSFLFFYKKEKKRL